MANPPAYPPTLRTAQGATRLITDPTDRPTYKINQECDARTAIARGLKEYVEQLSWIAFGGRDINFINVFDTWTQAEDSAKYPSAAVVGVGDGSYDASSFTPNAYETVEGSGLIKIAELKIDMQLAVYATDNKQRAYLVAMLEAALSPVDWMYGLRLELPHYFSNRATFEPGAMRYEDSSEDAIRRFRRAVITVRCSMPILRLSTAPFFAQGQPSLQTPLQVDVPFSPSGGGVSQVFVGALKDIADLIPPVVTLFWVPAKSATTTISSIILIATDNTAVTGYMITESSTPPLAAATGWSAAPPTSFTAGGTGTRTLYAWAKDLAGNVSGPAVATCIVGT